MSWGELVMDKNTIDQERERYADFLSRAAAQLNDELLGELSEIFDDSIHQLEDVHIAMVHNVRPKPFDGGWAVQISPRRGKSWQYLMDIDEDAGIAKFTKRYEAFIVGVEYLKEKAS